MNPVENLESPVSESPATPERKALTVNPAKTCQPIGATYASLGIHRCMPHSHGSQGCSSYLRMHLSRHFREPIPTTGSSFTEGTAVFGGASNLRQAVKNVAAIYKPDVMAIHTTCSTETIGDDVPAILENMRLEGEMPPGIRVFHANTPSYVGNHVTGFAGMTRAMVEAFAATPAADTASPHLNVIPGFVNPADVREIKSLLARFSAEDAEAGQWVLFPDTSDVLDAPNKGELELYPEGGTTLSELAVTSLAKATVALGREASETAATFLQKKFDVPSTVLPLPVGVRNTDAFVSAVAELTGIAVPKSIEDERGRLTDLMVDTHPHFHGKSVAIYGDADITVGLAALCAELGMDVRYVVTGSRDNEWAAEIEAALDTAALGVRSLSQDCEIAAGRDLFWLEEELREHPVDLLLGNSYGRYIARELDTPMVRAGFPIIDRAGQHLFPVLGYAGAMRLVERISDTLLDRYDRDVPMERFELVM